MADKRYCRIVRFWRNLDCASTDCRKDFFHLFQSFRIRVLIDGQGVNCPIKEISTRVLYACVLAASHWMAAYKMNVCG